MEESWDNWVAAALSKLAEGKLLRFTRPISLSTSIPSVDLDTFDGPRQWDRSSVEVELDDVTFHQWLQELPGDDGESLSGNGKSGRKMILFSGNDYLGLSAHPAVRNAASKAAKEHGMGPRGSALICGYTDYHRKLEISLAELKKKEDCLLCPTGFAANLAFMSAMGSISSLLATGKKPSKDEGVAIFSDALNHASIIDGIRLAERQQEAEVFVYQHGDMNHLDSQLSCCKMKKKVVITDSLFSMDGDFAPIVDLVELRNKHRFLLVIDDAHATLVCGRNGGGVPELYECENDVDICIGTLSKAAGCQGGFIACSNKWKQLIQSRGRSFIFSTALPVPLVAASHGVGVPLPAFACMEVNSSEFSTKETNVRLTHLKDLLKFSLDIHMQILAAILVARQEKWRRRAIWSRVHNFRSMTGLPITSPIISLVIGNEESALLASRHMLKSGFHVTAIRPPTVPPNSCRLRITLTAAHSAEDITRLVTALSRCFKFPALEHNNLVVSKL